MSCPNRQPEVPAGATGLASWRLSVFSVRAPIQVLNHVLNQIV